MMFFIKKIVRLLKLSMQIYNFSFKPTTFLEKMLIKMLSEYYILQVHFTKSKMRTIATSFNPIFLPILPLPPHQKVVPLQSNFQQEPGITPYREQNFQQIYVINM